jgi:hypothetical protein
MNKFFTFLIIAFLFVGVCSELYRDYLTYYPFKVLKINNIPYPVFTPIVTGGQSLKFHINYCVYRQASTQITQWLTNSENIIVVITSKFVTLHPGCYDITGSYFIPVGTAPGQYTLHSQGDYPINPQHVPFHIESETQTFIIK